MCSTPRDSLQEMRFIVRTISKRVDNGHIFSREMGLLSTKRLQNGGGDVILQHGCEPKRRWKEAKESFPKRFGGFLGGKTGGFLMVFLEMSSIRHVRMKLIRTEKQLVTKTKV